MEIKSAGSTPSRKVPADYFTGIAWQDPIIEAPSPSRIRAAWLRYDPGARSVWHTHPLGQILHVTAGVGLVQSWGGAVREIRPGDTIWFAPDEKHWHGAAPYVAMTSLTMQEALDGKYVAWMEAVTDDDYNAIKVNP
ncbi:MAG TPA: cupin domain-containing protein [Xanthobacteraceae bacterium]|jgi:quercetin dioxygenase-like cupin family protein|nr:cupin domain-containing protein [Xanthobacteraceae bacterium]